MKSSLLRDVQFAVDFLLFKLHAALHPLGSSRARVHRAALAEFFCNSAAIRCNFAERPGFNTSRLRRRGVGSKLRPNLVVQLLESVVFRIGLERGVLPMCPRNARGVWVASTAAARSQGRSLWEQRVHVCETMELVASRKNLSGPSCGGKC